MWRSFPKVPRILIIFTLNVDLLLPLCLLIWFLVLPRSVSDVMCSLIFLYAFLLFFSVVQGQFLPNPKGNAQGSGMGNTSPMNLSSLFDNRAFGMRPRDANFDGYHSE